MLDLGELILHIRADSSEAESAINGLSATSIAAGNLIASGIQAGAEAVVGFAKDSLQAGMDFDSAMSQVAATMGKTTDEIGNLRDFAQEMGSTTAFSATQAAEALNYMALAGYDADESMAMLPNVLNLAAAGNMDLARASDMVTDAQSALGLSFEETTVMVDQMAKTSSTTNTSVEQLGEAILRIGATGKTVAGGTAELSQVLGLLADNGIKGAEGGTKLRNVIMSLQTPTDKGAAALKELGISAYDSEGNFRSLADIMPEMSDALDDLTTEQRQAAISAIFNKTDIAAVNALLETTPDRWDEVATAIDNCKDSAEQMAATQLDNLEGDMTLFKSALEGAQIALSDALTPALREFVQFGSSALSDLTAAFRENGLQGVFEAAGDIVKNVADGVIQNAPEIISSGIEMVTNFISGIGEALPDLVSKGADVVVSLVEGLTESGNMSKMISASGDLINGLIEGIGKALPKLIAALPQIISAIVEGIIALIPQVVKLGVNILEGLIKGILSAITQIPACLKAVFDGIVNGIKSLFGIHSPSTVMAEIGVNVIEGMLKGISETWSKITEFFSGAIEKVVSFVSEGWENLKTKTVEKWEDIKKNVTEKTEELAKKAKEKWEDMKKTISDKTEELKKNVSDKWETLKKNVADKTEELKKNVKDKWEEVRKNVIDKAKEIVDKGKEKFEELKKNVTDKMEEVKKNVGEKWSQAVDALKKIDLKKIGSDIIGNFKSGLESAWKSVTSWVSGAVSSLRNTVSSAVNWVTSKVSGKHRTGLNEVPYDGYVAELHRGERVLTAAEANVYDQFRKQQAQPAPTNNTINFYGDYKFNDRSDIDYFMSEAGKLIRRKVG